MIDEYITVQNTTASTGDFLVRFIDWDGTILKEQWVNNGQDATPPTNPTHEKAIFNLWNTSYTNITWDKDIGAIYNIISGHTYMYITLTSGSTLTGYTGIDPVMYLYKYTTDTLNVYNDTTNTLIGTNSSSGNTSIDLSGQFTAGVGVNDYILRLECDGNYRFGNGTSSTSIFLQSTYKYILQKILIGSKVTVTGNYAFYQQKLQYVMLPSNFITMSDHSFRSTNIKAAIIPSGCTTINTYSFYGCYNLEVASIPNVSSFGNYAFYVCTSLNRIVFKQSMTDMTGQWIFEGCSGLVDVKLPPTLTKMRGNFFASCISIINIIVPSGVTSIETWVFNGCASLQSVTLPSTITSLDQYCMQSCGKLVEVILPAITPPTLSANTVFSGNYNLRIKVPADSVADYKAATNWSNPTLVEHIVAI